MLHIYYVAGVKLIETQEYKNIILKTYWMQKCKITDKYALIWLSNEVQHKDNFCIKENMVILQVLAIVHITHPYASIKSP